VKVPVWRDVQQHFTVMVPHQVARQGVRTVCKMVPETSMRTVTKDCGHWTTCTVRVPSRCGGCGDCGSCYQTICKRMWVPKIVTHQVPCTTYRPRYSQIPYTYHCTVLKPEARVRTMRVCDYKTEMRSRTDRVCSYRLEKRSRPVRLCDYKTEVRSRVDRVCSYRCEARSRQIPVTSYRTEMRHRDVQYTVCVPEQRTVNETVTTYKCVPYQVQQNYSVCVPYQVPRVVQHRVCHMVAKTVMVQVRGSCGCGI
jgi:hypothetical protein